MNKRRVARELVKLAKDLVSASMGSENERYLDMASSSKKNKILKAVAKHYGVSVSEAEKEVTDPDAEALYEYLSFDNRLAMQVYRELTRMK